MADYIIQDTTLTAIADAIREKFGETEQMTPSEMANTIAAIEVKTKDDLSVDGHVVTAPAGYYASGVIKVVTTAPRATPSVTIDNSTGIVTASVTQSEGYVAAGTETETLNLTAQAEKTVTPSTSAQIAVAANVYTTGEITVAAIQTETKIITANGTYTPTSGKYFSSVTVNTPVGYKSGDVVNAASISLNLGTSYMSVSVTYGTSVVNTNGVLSLGDSTSVSASSAGDLNVIKGKYVKISSTIYYIPTDANITYTGNSYNKSYTTDKASPVFVIA